jgi:ABC-2 type transport system permease protein
MHDTLRTLRWSIWLGWQIESNWTEPWLFAIYVIAKPLAGSLLLVFMCLAAGKPQFLSFAYLGNAIYMLVGSVGFGMSGAIVQDRENYHMLKYIRISPIGLQSYLIGRGLAQGAQGFLGALLTILAGLLLPLGLREAVLPWYAIAWGWLLLYLVLGTVMLLAIGMILAGGVLNMARHGMFLSEGVGSALYLLSGAIFPLSVLPPWLQWVALALPPTYWMEGVRRSLLSPTGEQSPLGRSPLSGWDHLQLTSALALSTLAVVLLAQVVFRWGERRAQRLGRYDQTTGF